MEAEIHMESNRTDLCHRWNYNRFLTSIITQLIPSVTDIVSDIVQSSAPIFQKLCLIDLPTEVLCHVMQCCTHSEALRLGLSCALLRNVSLQYIYTVSRLTVLSRYKH